MPHSTPVTTAHHITDAMAAPAAGAEAAAEDEAQRRRSLKPLLTLRPYVLRYPRMLAAAAAALVMSALAMLAVPMAARRMVDYGFGAGDGRFIDRYFAMLIGIGLMLALASAARFYFVNWLGERVVADIRADVFAHLSRLGPAFFERTHSGEVMSRLTADTTQIKAAAGTALSQAARNIIMLVGALIMMLVTSPKLSGIVLLAIPAIVFPLMAYGRVVRRLSRKAQDTLAEASAYASENLSAVRTMQAFGHEGAVVDAVFGGRGTVLFGRPGTADRACGPDCARHVPGRRQHGRRAVVRLAAVVKGEMTGGRLSSSCSTRCSRAALWRSCRKSMAR